MPGRSREGAWIEIRNRSTCGIRPYVAPARERGLKYVEPNGKKEKRSVAPARERGLKYQLAFTIINTIKVAPARERGLKCLTLLLAMLQQ